MLSEGPQLGVRISSWGNLNSVVRPVGAFAPEPPKGVPEGWPLELPIRPVGGLGKLLWVGDGNDSLQF